jgi:hypothetical protein
MLKTRIISLAHLAVLSLTLGLAAASNPVAAAPVAAQVTTAPPVYYLDGVRTDKATVDKLRPKTIAYMNVLDEKTAQQVFGTESGKVAIVVTRQGQNSAAVLALNKKIEQVAPLSPATNR